MVVELPKTYKAVQVIKFKEALKINEVSMPEVTTGKILVKIKASGLCHTDIHVADGDHGQSPLPMTLGHEGCGEVVKVNDDVTNVRVGQRVGVPWLYSACGTCVDCFDGWESVCATQKNAGSTVHGGMAEYVLADAKYVGIIPDELSYEQAAPIMCAGLTVYKALKVSGVKPGQYVVITGAAGGLGHVACQYAKAMGMKVIAVTRKVTPEKAAMFKSYSVDRVVDLSNEKITEAVNSATNQLGAHGAIILAPVNSDITDAVTYVGRRGTIVPVSIPSGKFECHTLLVVIKGIKIAGSIVGTRNDLQEALQFAAEGKVVCKVQTRKFEEVNDIMSDLRDGKVTGRTVIMMA